MAISAKGVSNIYAHRGKQADDQKIYLKECINRRLLPFVDKYHSTVVCKIIESSSSFDFYRFFFLTNVIFSFQFYRQSIDSDVLSQYLLRKSSYII